MRLLTSLSTFWQKVSATLSIGALHPLHDFVCILPKAITPDVAPTMARQRTDNGSTTARLRPVRALAVLCLLLTLGIGNAWCTDPDYTFTLASGDFTSSSHSKTSGDFTWTHSHTSGTESYGWDDTYGFKFGYGKSSYPTAFKITSSSFSSKIKKVVVTANVNSKKSCMLDVKVGSTTYGSQATINTKNNDTKEFSIADGSAVNGAIELSFSSNTGPLFLKKIEVYYLAASCAAPTALSKGSFNSGTQQMPISWTSAAGKVDICYSTSSTKPDATPSASYTVVSDQTSSPVNLDVSGLSASTNYYVWGRSVCGASNKSDWTAITDNYFTLPSHTLTVTKSGGDAGCSVSPTSQTVVEGRTVSITATAGSGYDFSSWAVTGTGATLSSTSSNPTTFTMGTADATVTGTFTVSSTPTITVSASSLSGFSYIEGAGPSSNQNFTVSGSNLTAKLTVTAPTDYEICKTSGGTYTSSVDVSTSEASSGQVIYVRLKSGKSAGTYNSENVTVASSNSEATSKTVTLSGSVLKPTITASPASVTSWSVDVGGTPTTKSVTVTGSYLRGNITAALTGGDAASFSISPTSIAKATAEGAGGTITISYTGSVAAAATKSTTLRLTADNATTVDVSVSISIVADSREQYQLLTNASNLTAGAKIVLVYEYESGGDTKYRAMKTYTGTKGSDAVEASDSEFEVSGTTLYLEDGHNVQVIDIEESDSYFALKAGSSYLQNSGDKLLTTTTTTPLPDAAKWAISIDGTDYTAAITSQGTQGQDIRYNPSLAITAQPFRCYANTTGQDIYIYYQPSTTPSIAVSATSLSDFTYVVGNGPSSPAKTFTVSGMNLSGTLTVALTAGSDKYEISKTSATTGFGSSVTFTSLSGTLSAQTIWVRLKSDLSRNLSISGTITASGAGVAVGNNKTVSLSGSVTNAMHTLTMARSGGTSGCTTTPAEGSTTNLEDTYGTQAITASPAAGYQFVNWTKTSGTLANANSASTTFTMGTANATVTANFSQIMVSSISVSGDATVKTGKTATYSATVTPDGALTKTVTWSVTSGTGTATINSSTGELTGGTAGTVTVRATATDGSAVYGEKAVTIQDAVSYKFVKMTSTPATWEDDDYLIVNEGSNTILKGSDPVNQNTGTAGEGNTTTVSITTSTSPYSITLEDNKDDAFHISYVSTKGYLVQGVGGDNLYVVRAGTATGGSSVKELASNNSTDTRYWYSIAHNKLTYSSGDHMGYNSSSYRFYTSSTADNLVLYKLDTQYTVTCNTPTNGTLSSNKGSASSSETVTLTVTPSSGYELNTLTITKDGGGTVTPTKVSETSYTFSMPKDNVTVTATFVTVRTKDLIFNVPSCVTQPSTLSSKATGASVTLPSEPSGTPDGYTFVGWTTTETVTPTSAQPTTHSPGSYIVPSGSANINMYALYSEGEISVGTGTFNYIKEASSGLTTLSNLTSGTYYLLSSSGNNANILSNTISGKRVGYSSCTGAGTSNATVSTAEGVYYVVKTGSYYTFQNVATGKYLASNGNASQATMMDDDGTDDHVKWTITSTTAGYKLKNKYNDANSVNAYLAYSSGNGYGCYAESNGATNIYFYKAASGAVTNTTEYTTSPDCYCDYQLMVSTNSGSTWSEAGCFTKVKPDDDTDHEWQLSNYTMPTNSSSNLLKVQKNGSDAASMTAAWQSGWIPMAELQGSSADHKAFDVAGAVGTLRIYDNDGGNSVDANSNFYLGFMPTYQITHGVDGGSDPWTNETFEYVETAGEHVIYETDITTAPSGYYSNSNYKFYVGARKSDGTTKFVDNNGGGSAHKKSVTQAMNTMGGMNSSDIAGRSGVYRIWANYYNNSVDGDNWYCQFIPYYVVYYYDVNGNEITEWRDVLTSSTTTVHAYAASQTGWATSLGGAANATYAANASITPDGDVRLYQVAPTYTVTYSVASETSAYNGTTQKVIQGQSLTLPTITFSCGLYDTFVGWVTGSDIAERDPAEKIDEPSTLVGTGGATYTPTANVTLKALYGYDCSGNSGWQKQTSIKNGRYLIAAYNHHRVYAGDSGSSYGKKVDTTDDDYEDEYATLKAKPSGAHEIEVTVVASNKFTMRDVEDNKYLNYSGSSNDLSFTAAASIPSPLTNAYYWKLSTFNEKNGQIESFNVSGRFLQSPNGSSSSSERFACYTSNQDGTWLYRYTRTGYFTTNPTCDIPTELTVTFNANSPTGDAGDVSDLPDEIVESFSSYPTLSSTIDFGDNSTPTCDGYTIQKWNTAANGSGTDYALDATISSFAGAALNLYAIWDRTYSVTFNDQGSTTVRTQTSSGASVAVPSATAACGSWTFVGWTDYASQLAAEPTRPNIVISSGTSTYTPTRDIILRAVYSKSYETCENFAAGVSGTYIISQTVSGTTSYVQATGSTHQFDKSSESGADATAEKFTIAYSTIKKAYTIRNSAGYITYNSGDIDKGSSTPYYWNITSSGSGWKITPPGVSTKWLTVGTYFKIMGSDYNALNFTKATTTYYYTIQSCDATHTIKFHNGGGTINNPASVPVGSWNSTTKVLSGLSDCDKVTKWPTATYDGWNFLGWSPEDYSNSGKHSADYEDENGSTSEPSTDILYGNDANSYTVLGGNIDLYPVFTRIPNNEPFDTDEGGDYVMYYLESGSDDGYGAEVRVYAGAYEDNKRYQTASSCASARVFTFTKYGDVWHIYDKTAGKYVAGVSGDNDLVHRSDLSGDYDDWTIEVSSGNQFDAYCQDGGRYISFSTTADKFANYSVTASPTLYKQVYLGSCEERIFSSEPNATPILDLTGEPIVTSSSGQTVRAATPFVLTGSHLGDANKVTLTGTNLKFATSTTATPVASLNVTVSSESVAATNIYVYYTPTATTDGTENIIVTASATTSSSVEVKRTTASVYARHLPANFVIAAQASSGKWYALPADITSSSSSTAGVLIEVDDDDDPTSVTSAPENTQWGLRNVQSARQTTNGLGHHLTFTERLTTATANNQKTLYNGSGTGVQVYAMWSGYASTNPEQYEWVPTTTDLKDYTLTSAKTFDGDAGARTLSMNTSGVFGTLLQAKAYDGKVRLLPAEFYTTADAQIVEWKANSVVVMYTGSQTSATTKVGTNSASSSQTLTTHKLTHGIYELTTSQALTSNDGKKLELTFGTSEKLIVEIPVIISGTSTAATGHASQDLIILKDAKLTAAATKYDYRNVYVYGGGKLNIPSGTSLGVNNIILRAGGITTSGIGSSPSAAYDYVYPQVFLAGTLTSSVANIKYEYITDYTHWYHLCLPFNATLTSIHYPQEYYGDNVSAENHGSWQIKRYDGATRATGDYAAWKDIEADSPAKTEVTAGVGYIYWGAPKKVTVGESTERQAWGIQRMTMPTSASAAITAETANKTVSGLSAYSSGAGQVNDQGWNLIGNPYMVNLTGLTSTSIKTGALEKEMVSGQWTGRWTFNSTNSNRYITVPDNHFETYEAVAIAASDMTLTAGRAFFVQLADAATAVEFDYAKKAALAPAWQQAEQTADIETGVVMSSETMKDEVNFWIKDGKTAEYEFNADYPKTPNQTNFNIYGVHETGKLSWIAVSPEIAEGSMAIGYQVPAAGDYTLSLSEKFPETDIEALFVTDHAMSPEVTMNLLLDDYTFTVNQAESNDERFTVSVKLKKQTDVVTDIGNGGTTEVQAVKFIHNDKLYILRNGLLYDATGKRVNVTNK